MTTPGFDLIFGSNTLKQQGIVIDFWMREITLDEISLLMRDTKKLTTKDQVEKSWIMNNSIYKDMPNKLQSTLEAMKHFILILDAKYKMVDH